MLSNLNKNKIRYFFLANTFSNVTCFDGEPSASSTLSPPAIGWATRESKSIPIREKKRDCTTLHQAGNTSRLVSHLCCHGASRQPFYKIIKASAALLSEGAGTLVTSRRDQLTSRRLRWTRAEPRPTWGPGAARSGAQEHDVDRWSLSPGHVTALSNPRQRSDNLHVTSMPVVKLPSPFPSQLQSLTPGGDKSPGPAPHRHDKQLFYEF